MKLRITTIAVSAALALAPFSALAADTAAPAKQQGPLAAGPAAGVKDAQSWEDNRTAYIVGGVIIVGGAIWLLSDNGNGHHSSGTTGNHP